MGVSGTRDWVTNFAHVPRHRLRPRLFLYFAALVTQSRVLGAGCGAGERGPGDIRPWAVNGCGNGAKVGFATVAADAVAP